MAHGVGAGVRVRVRVRVGVRVGVRVSAIDTLVLFAGAAWTRSRELMLEVEELCACLGGGGGEVVVPVVRWRWYSGH